MIINIRTIPVSISPVSAFSLKGCDFAVSFVQGSDQSLLLVKGHTDDLFFTVREEIEHMLIQAWPDPSLLRCTQIVPGIELQYDARRPNIQIQGRVGNRHLEKTEDVKELHYSHAFTCSGQTRMIGKAGECSL